jgi:hypothetical protein
MLGRSLAFILLLALSVVVGARDACAQAATTSTFDIPSGDASVRARFFAASGGTPIATVLIVPGWGGDSTDAAADTAYASRIRGSLARAVAPRGAVRFEPEALFDELVRRERDNDLVRLAPRLDHRAVLLIGGWDDTTAPIESEILPVYRALAGRPGADATILAYPEGHSLRTQRDRVADDIVAWLAKRSSR